MPQFRTDTTSAQWRRGLAALTLCLTAASALAQAPYPNRPIRLVVPFPPGGSADIVARSVAQRFYENTKQTLIVDNRPGADTIIGMEAVRTAPPDGYTVGYAIGSALTMNQALYSKLPYNPVRDFAPVMVIANVPLALGVHESVPARNVRELAALIKSKPNELPYGQGNIVSKVATEAFAAAAGGKLTEVPYKGSAASTLALMTGEVKMTIDPLISLMPHAQAGKVRVLAVTASTRSEAFPNIPTFAESGFANYAFDNWHAIVVPSQTPPEIVKWLHTELSKAARHPDVAAKVTPAGVEIVASTPEELRTRIVKERDHWSKEIRQLGIRID